MAKTPRRAAAAMAAGGEKVKGVTVRELTLGLAAVLERIESPLVVGREDGVELSLREMLPTIFAMTRPAYESEALLAEGGPEMLMGEAVRWADGVTTEHGLEMARACGRAAQRLAGVMPQGMPGEGRGGNGRAAGTGG